jgi:Ca-activated chloride channel family protein
MSNARDHYALLGVLRDASQEEIKRAYYEAARRLHPDTNKSPGETEFFLDIQQAYEVLSNPKRRAEYDKTLPKVDEPNLPVNVQIQYSRPNLVRLREPQLVYVQLDIRPRQQTDKIPAPPLNVCLVLDRSTSMKDAKMDLLKAAAIQVLKGLRPEDIFSLVTFSDRADVVIPASYRVDTKRLESQIRMIQPSGATELYQGLEAGLEQVRRSRDPSRLNHLILLTDGHTYGDEQPCLNLAAEAAAQNIGISSMGIGADWNDAFLDELAGRTGNTSQYIARPQDIQRFLAEKFNELTRVFSEEVTLDYTSTPGAEAAYAFRLQPETGPLKIENPLHLGPILQDTHLSVLFEFLIQPAALDTDLLRILEGNLKIAIAARPTPLPPMRLQFSRDVGAEAGTDPPPVTIIQALSRLTLYRMQERARNEVQAGDYEGATRSLKNLASHLLAQGHQGLAHTVMLEMENVQRQQAFSLSGEKDIKYGTRALIMTEGM